MALLGSGCCLDVIQLATNETHCRLLSMRGSGTVALVGKKSIAVFTRVKGSCRWNLYVFEYNDALIEQSTLVYDTESATHHVCFVSSTQHMYIFNCLTFLLEPCVQTFSPERFRSITGLKNGWVVMWQGVVQYQLVLRKVTAPPTPTPIRLDFGAEIKDVRASDTGDLFAVLARQTLYIKSYDTLKTLFCVPLSNPDLQLTCFHTMTEVGPLLALYISAEHRLYVYDILRNGTVFHVQIDDGSDVRSVHFSDDGKAIFISSLNNTICVDSFQNLRIRRTSVLPLGVGSVIAADTTTYNRLTTIVPIHPTKLHVYTRLLHGFSYAQRCDLPMHAKRVCRLLLMVNVRIHAGFSATIPVSATLPMDMWWIIFSHVIGWTRWNPVQVLRPL